MGIEIIDHETGKVISRFVDFRHAYLQDGDMLTITFEEREHIIDITDCRVHFESDKVTVLTQQVYDRLLKTEQQHLKRLARERERRQSRREKGA